MLDLLYCRDEEVRLCTDLGTALRDARNMFLSERARHSFGSYARSQLKRIQGHRKWLLAPPRSKPTRADFGLPEVSVLPRDQLVAAENAVRQRLDQWQLDLGDLSKAQAIAVRDRMAKVLAEQQVGSEDRFTAAARGVGLGESFIEVMKWERAYRNAMRGWKQYQNWKFNRNPARAALEAKYGYDTKHAAHLVRLLRMAVEILREGQVFVWRGQRDADELRAIRDGAWSYDQLIEFTDSAEAKLVELELAGRVAVPKAPDLEGIDDLVVRMVGAALDRHA